MTSGGSNGFQAKQVLLTYSQVEKDVMGEPVFTKQELFEWIKDKFDPTFIKVAQETHNDGGIHFHAVIRWSNKQHYRNMNIFDYKDHHPNWKVIKHGREHWTRVLMYLDKEDKAPLTTNQLELYNPLNFEKERSNYEAYQQAMHQARLKKVTFPITLGLNGVSDITGGKKRHLWIWGESNCGKSTWFRKTFDEYEYYLRPRNYDCPFDGYKNQTIICYDDIAMERVQWDELVALCETHRPYTEQYPGRTRYANRYLDGGERWVVVISNHPPPTTYANHPAFLARFNVVQVKQSTFMSCRQEASMMRVDLDDDDDEPPASQFPPLGNGRYRFVIPETPPHSPRREHDRAPTPYWFQEMGL